VTASNSDTGVRDAETDNSNWDEGTVQVIATGDDQVREAQQSKYETCRYCPDTVARQCTVRLAAAAAAAWLQWRTCVAQLVVCLVALAQALQDLIRLVNGGLGHGHRLEAAARMKQQQQAAAQAEVSNVS
jgi:hypothetical protein